MEKYIVSSAFTEFEALIGWHKKRLGACVSESIVGVATKRTVHIKITSIYKPKISKDVESSQYAITLATKFSMPTNIGSICELTT